MIAQIEALQAEVEAFAPKTPAEVEAFRIRLLGKKGSITALFDAFKSAPAEEKRTLGQALNRLKTTAAQRIEELRTALEEAALATGAGDGAEMDMTRPATAERVGTRHPISLVRNRILDIFGRIGFVPADGPER